MLAKSIQMLVKIMKVSELFGHFFLTFDDWSFNVLEMYSAKRN